MRYPLLRRGSLTPYSPLFASPLSSVSLRVLPLVQLRGHRWRPQEAHRRSDWNQAVSFSLLGQLTRLRIAACFRPLAPTALTLMLTPLHPTQREDRPQEMVRRLFDMTRLRGARANVGVRQP